jgi:2,4-dienoyl-CoA reductase (NADPH2)
MSNPSPIVAQSPFEPIRIGPLTLRNRFIKSATNEGMAKGGVPSKMLAQWHAGFAEGGIGLTTVAYCAVSPDGRTFVDQVTMDRRSIPDLRALTAAVHGHGAAVSAQITHGGAFTFLPELTSGLPMSSSGGFNAVGALSGRFRRRGMTEADMEQVAEEFAVAARLAREAGFDAVEIHMGHGYLLSQFLSPMYNKRRDRYGGDAEGRARFPAMVLRRVLDAVGKDLAVVCKICVTEGTKRGATADDAAIVAKVLEDTGAHLLVLSGGMNVESPWIMFGSPLPRAAVEGSQGWVMKMAMRILKAQEPKTEFREMYFLEHSRKVRAAVGMPLAYLGGVESLANVETAMAAGFDCVALGRALIRNPDLVNQFQAGEAERAGCNRCNQCVSMMYTAGGTSCVLDAPNDAALNALPAAA